jgi:hypothetical protein
VRTLSPIAVLAILPLGLAAAEAPASIGTATMQADGTIVMQLISLPPGPTAHGTFTVKPTDKTYKETLDHLGGLKPGETKSVPPWPDDPPKNKTER